MTPFYRQHRRLRHKLESQNDYSAISARLAGGRATAKPSATNMGFCYSQLLTATVSIIGYSFAIGR
jgi:hypothetical protein